MATVNNGQQVLSYDYRDRGLAEVFNKINYKLHLPGIYSGGELSKASETTVNITPFVCVYNENVAKIAVRIETIENALVENVDSTNCWIVGRFTWLNTEDNYMEFLAIEFSNILSTDLIFGCAEFDGSTLLETFDYTRKSWEGSHYYNLHNSTPFKVVADEPYSNSVIVQTGGPYFFNGRWIELTVDTTSPEVDFPISEFGRTDAVVIDSLDSSVKIIKGSISSTQIPEVDTQYLVVGLINLPADELSIVKGNYIEYIHPSKSLTSYDSALSLLEKAKTVDGSGSGIVAQYLGSYDKDFYKSKVNEAVAYNFTILPQSTSIQRLNCGVYFNNNFYMYSYESTSGVRSINSGDTWSTVSIGYSFSSSETNGSIIVANKATSGTYYYTSTNGTTFTQRTSPWQFSIGIYITNNRFFSFTNGDTRVYTSTNGTSWSYTDVPYTTTPNFRDIAYGNGTYVLVSVQSRHVHTSTDAITWVQRTNALPSTPGWQYNIEFGNGVFIITCINDFLEYFISSDGITWQTKYFPTPIQYIKFYSGFFLAVYNTVSYISSDAINWKSINHVSVILGTQASMVVGAGQIIIPRGPSGTDIWKTSLRFLT